jgi:hypothetical protein
LDLTHDNAAVPALLLDILLAHFTKFRVPRTLCWLLRKDATFQEIEFRCQENVYVRGIAEGEQNIPISINALTRAFECPQSRVHSAFDHGLKSPGQGGKHTALDQHHEQRILDWIQQNAKQSTRVNKKEIKDYWTSQFKALITRGWVNSFILRDPDKTIQAKSVPQEQQRWQVFRVFLERTVQNLNKHVQGCLAELVFTLDKVGISDWEDRKLKRVLIPATILDQTIHHGISRTVKHIPVIACVFAVWKSLTPYMITSQDSASVREQLKKQGVQFGADFVSKSNRKPCVNAGIFLDFIRTVFVPHIAELRTLDAFSEEVGVLLMRDCPSHIIDDLIHLLTEAPVGAITFAPHTTQIFQVLDVRLFSVLKCHPIYELSFRDEQATVRFISAFIR